MVGHLRALFIAIAAASLVACGGSDTFQRRDIPMTRVNALWATTDLRQNYTIRTDADWRAVWQAHEPPTLPPTEQPVVDFSSNMVLGVTLGSAPNGCHGLAIDRVIEEENQVRVEYSVATPAPNVLCVQVIVPLTDFVVVERIDKPVAFLQSGA